MSTRTGISGTEVARGLDLIHQAFVPLLCPSINTQRIPMSAHSGSVDPQCHPPSRLAQFAPTQSRTLARPMQPEFNVRAPY